MMAHAILLLLSVQGIECFGLQGTTSTHGLSINKQFRPSTSLLFESQDDNGDDEKQQTSGYKNDLDIFGQPKDADGKQTKRKLFFDEEGDIRGPDRIKSCIPYILPLIDGDNFGKYIYDRIPPLGNLDYVLLRPIVDGFHAVPFLSIVLFMIFALGPQFTGQSRAVRFNAQQAILIDVALIFPQILGEAVADAEANFPRALMEPCSNFVWYFIVSCLIYAVTSNLRGKRPDQIPFISGAADYAIGPF